MSRIHHEIELVDCYGSKHRVHCIEVNFITDPQEQSDYTKVQNLFPFLPRCRFDRPNVEVGLLLGQNKNALLPTGGTGQHKVGILRVRRTLLGKHGFVLEGWHPDIWRAKLRKSKV